MAPRIFNFSAGPATMPPAVLEQTARDVVDFRNTGMGLIEISHRSKEFMAVVEETEANLRDLMAIPNGYKVLFLQGGASSQFFMVPMNLLGPGKKACYLNTGTWAKKAIKEAQLFGEIEVAYSSEPGGYKQVPGPGDYQVPTDAEYLYYVSNNTIFGTQFPSVPKADCLLVSDMSSDILSRPVDVSQFGVIFAGAQKNLGPAGVTVVIIRDDLLDRTPPGTPTMLAYKTHADKGSMFNTPPCFAVYVVGEVLKWILAQGGVEAIAEMNRDKAGLLYRAIDAGNYYRGHALADSRSLMNVSFTLPNTDLEKKFISEATAIGLNGLKGHRSIGGCRASIYNAFPREGVVRLVEFMEKFAAENPAA